MNVNESDLPFGHAYVLKLEGFELEADPFSKLENLRLHPNNAVTTGRVKVRVAPHWVAPPQRDSLAYWSEPSDTVYWLVNVLTPGEYIVRGEMATRFRPARMYLDNGEDRLEFDTEPRDKYGEGVLKEYGRIYFANTGLHRVELGVRDAKDFPGIQRLWQIDMAPVD